MKKLEIMFETLDCELGVVKSYEWSELHDEIVNVFDSLLGDPVNEIIETYTENNCYLGEFHMKRKILSYDVLPYEELIAKNILRLGDELDWNLKYKWSFKE